MRLLVAGGALLGLVLACCWAPGGWPSLPPSAAPSVAIGLPAAPPDHGVYGVSDAAFVAESAHLPQLDGLATRFAAAPAREVASLDGLLVCRLLTAPGGSWDVIGGGPDVYLRVSAGRASVTTGEAQGDGHFSVPVTGLTRGSGVAVTVFDRDVLFDDEMASGETSFEGRLPFHVTLTGTVAGDLECGAMDDAAFAGEVTLALQRTEVALSALGHPTARLDDALLGWPERGGTEAHAAMAQMLALRGPSHVDWVSTTSRARDVVGAYRASLGAAVSAALGSLPPSGTPVALPDGSPATLSVHCDATGVPAVIAPPPGECVIAVQVTPARRWTLDVIEAGGRASTMGIDERGDIVIGSLLGVQQGSAVAPPPDLPAGVPTVLWWSLPRALGPRSVISVRLPQEGARSTFRP